MNSSFAIIKAVNGKVYHYSGVINGQLHLCCGSVFKKETLLERFIGITPEEPLCKKCEKVINDN